MKELAEPGDHDWTVLVAYKLSDQNSLGKKYAAIRKLRIEKLRVRSVREIKRVLKGIIHESKELAHATDLTVK